MIQVKKIIYTPASIFAMFVTPQNVLPAPPVGKINNIIAISHDMVFATLAYTTATQLLYASSFANGNYIFGDFNLLASIVNYNQPVAKSNYNVNPFQLVPSADDTVFSTVKDFFVTTDLQAATGDSNVIGYIVYEEKVLV